MKLRELNNNDLGNKIKGVAILCGLHNQIGEVELAMLVDFLKHHFVYLEEEGFVEAFKLYAANKLEYKEPVYNNLSAFFIGKVLSSYKDFKAKDRAKPKRIDLKALEAPKMDEDPKDSYTFICGVVQKEGKLPRIANWTEAFKYLVQSEIVTISETERELFKSNVKASIQNEYIEAKRKGRPNQRLRDVLNSSKLFSNECKTRYVKQYFNDMLSK